MKIKITENGTLVINSINKYCPYQPVDQPDSTNIRCGDWCALFSIEIDPSKTIYFDAINLESTIPAHVKIKLCRRSYQEWGENFTDERNQNALAS